jgi:hypothetical protein
LLVRQPTVLPTATTAATTTRARFWRRLTYRTRLPSVVRVHAPDHIIEQLGGRFGGYTTLAQLPKRMQAAPHATTAAAVELWLWWSPPLPGGRAAYYNAAPPTLVRRSLVRTVMLVTARLQHTPWSEGLPHLPFELWNMMLGFAKHDALPVLEDDGWEPAEDEFENEDEDGSVDEEDYYVW